MEALSFAAENGYPDLGQCGGGMDDIDGEGVHQICSFLSTDNLWNTSHSKENLEQMLQDLAEEASRRDLKPEPGQLMVDKHVRIRRKE